MQERRSVTIRIRAAQIHRSTSPWNIHSCTCYRVRHVTLTVARIMLTTITRAILNIQWFMNRNPLFNLIIITMEESYDSLGHRLPVMLPICLFSCLIRVFS